MSQAVAIETQPQASSAGSGALREAVVLVSMVVLVITAGFVMRTNLGFGTAFSVVGAICLYWALMLVHVSVRRGCALAALGDTIDRLDAENVELKRFLGARLGPQPRGPMPWPGGPRVPMGQAGPQQMAPSQPATPHPGVAREAATVVAERVPVGPAATPAGTEPGTAARRESEPKGSAPQVMPQGVPKAVEMSRESSLPPPLPMAASPAARPAGMAASDDTPTTPVLVPSAIGIDGDPSHALKASREAEIATMQSLIRELADQINGAAPVANAGAVHGARPAVAPPAEIDPADALREAAEAMRSSLGDMRAARTAADVGGADYARLAKVAAAVEGHRIDLYLDPILGLDDRRARHFEVSVRLRAYDGSELEAGSYEADVAGTGLLARIDAEKLTRSAHIAGQIRERGGSASLFTGVAGESLTDTTFQGSVAAALGPRSGLAERYVMAIAQSEIRGFGPAHWDALAGMAQHGLRFALVDVVDLDLDFEALKLRGFDFVRLDASVFLEGLPAPHGFVPAADLCRHLSTLGFSLIVGRITDETTLAKIHGFGAVLGQGVLFGGPRPVQLPASAA